MITFLVIFFILAILAPRLLGGLIKGIAWVLLMMVCVIVAGLVMA